MDESKSETVGAEVVKQNARRDLGMRGRVVELVVAIVKMLAEDVELTVVEVVLLAAVVELMEVVVELLAEVVELRVEVLDRWLGYWN